MTRFMKSCFFFSLAGLALIIALFVLGNMVVQNGLSRARLDLTQARSFTLSEGTRTIVRDLKEPVTLQLFLSDRLVRQVPAAGFYTNRVRELLEEYVAASNGKLHLEIHNPESFSDEEDRAVAAGLQGVPVDQSGENIYFGLVAVGPTDERAVIPFFQSEREKFLEYDITKLVQGLKLPKKKTVGLISTLPMDGDIYLGQGTPRPWLMFSQIQQYFGVRVLGLDLTQIPADIDVLMVVHPTALPESTLYAIDQYVMRGGKVLAMVDPNSEGLQLRPDMPAKVQNVAIGMVAKLSSDMPQLLQSWGLRLVPNMVVTDRTLARQVNGGDPAHPVIGDFIGWLEIDPAHMSPTDIVTTSLTRLYMATPGALEKLPGSALKIEPMVLSSPESMRMDAGKFMGKADIVALQNEFKPSGKASILAARASGPARSAFPAARAGLAYQAQSTGPVNVIVVADTDMLEDHFWVQTQEFYGQTMAMPTSNNADFIVNALENLSGTSALISLRGHASSDRPFVKLHEIGRRAEITYRAKEQELRQRLKETEQNLQALDKQRPKGGQILSPDQQKELVKFRADMLRLRKQLRDVQHALRQDVEGLENTLRFINIALIPLIVACVAVGVGIMRRRKMRRTAGDRS